MICVPVIEKTNEEARLGMLQGFTLADIVELRIDWIRDIDLYGLLQARQGKVLITNRHRKEGGGFTGTERERVSLLKQAVVLGCDYVDIELNTDKDLKDDLIRTAAGRRNRTLVIVSWHQMTGTPSDRVLKTRLKRCFEDGAAMAKIVTMARTADDNLRMLKFVSFAVQEGLAVTAFCMGEKGRLSRAMAPFFGSCLSYASSDRRNVSAPGQWTVQEMRTLLRLFDEEKPER
jgi:3-dehydroquinate dehydratase type I